jgi:hypothetical protein
MSLQIFAWDGCSHQDHEQQRTYYNGFTLQETKYRVGDCVYLFPESEGIPLYLGCIQSAFADGSPGASDTHCVEVGGIRLASFGAFDEAMRTPNVLPALLFDMQVRWFERYSVLEPCCKGVKYERELVELEDADVNPIGCLAGKANVLRAKSYDEVRLSPMPFRDIPAVEPALHAYFAIAVLVAPVVIWLASPSLAGGEARSKCCRGLVFQPGRLQEGFQPIRRIFGRR